MNDLQNVPINDENLWRLDTPGADGWAHSGAAQEKERAEATMRPNTLRIIV